MKKSWNKVMKTDKDYDVKYILAISYIGEIRKALNRVGTI